MHFTTIATISIAALAFISHGVSASPQKPNQFFKRAAGNAPDTPGSSGGGTAFLGKVAGQLTGLFTPSTKPQDSPPKKEDKEEKD